MMPAFREINAEATDYTGGAATLAGVLLIGVGVAAALRSPALRGPPRPRLVRFAFARAVVLGQASKSDSTSRLVPAYSAARFCAGAAIRDPPARWFATQQG